MSCRHRIRAVELGPFFPFDMPLSCDFGRAISLTLMQDSLHLPVPVNLIGEKEGGGLFVFICLSSCHVDCVHEDTGGKLLSDINTSREGEWATFPQPDAHQGSAGSCGVLKLP